MKTWITPSDLAPGKTVTTPPEGPAPEEASAPAPGTLAGRIRTRDGRSPIAGAQIYVSGAEAEAITDAEGRFTLQLPAGRYEIAIIHLDFATDSRSVTVKAGASTPLEVEISFPTAPPDDYVVIAPHIRGGVAAVLSKRREATGVTDAIGAADLSRAPDSTASAATRRIVGASVVGGQFLFVRGLGGRYTNVRLNGVPLPSTDPDLPGFQLDLFPTSLLAGLTIAKTFTPDIPGDFAGGSLNVETREFPEEFTANATLGARFNTQTTGRRVLTYDGGSTDFLGFDDGTRALPDTVPDRRLAPDPARAAEPRLTNDDVDRVARSFANKWKQERTTAWPNLSLGLSVGDTLKPGGKRLGYLFTLGYRLNQSRFIEDFTTLTNDGSGGLRVRQSMQREVGLEQAQVGALGTVAYEPAEGHRLRLVSLLTQTGDDTSSLITGFSDNENQNTRQSIYRFIARRLLFHQILGEHSALGPFELDWQLNSSLIHRAQPDSRFLVYQGSPAGGDFTYNSTLAGNGDRSYSELDQQDFGGGAGLRLPLGTSSVGAGYLGRTSRRRFTARLFETRFLGAPEQLTLPPEELFAPGNIPDVFRIVENTRPNDGHLARESLHAGYFMLDAETFPWLRVLAGIRLESFHQEVQNRPPVVLAGDAPREGTDRTDVDRLPAGSLIFSLSETMNVRAAYGATVARPLVRELAPFQSNDFQRRRTVQGNPDLVRTFIHNLDLRWEMFPTSTEVFAVSGFYKAFEHPIETVIWDTNGNISFDNIDGARSYGAEIEARLSLGPLADALSRFSVVVNLALIRSSVSLSDEQRRLATSRERPLSGQSPYIANLSLGYDSEDSDVSVYAYYNVFGRRIVEVGRSGLPDVYEQPIHSVDLTARYRFAEHWTAGFSAQNLLHQQVVLKQGDFDFSRSQRGMTFGARLSWQY